jgi:hypothetical protein
LKFSARIAVGYFNIHYQKRGKTMQFKRVLGLALILSLVFVLTACGGGNASPTTAPDTDSTEEASGGGDDSGGGSADLPETISTTLPTGGTLTVGYPEGWTATEAGGAITLTSSDMAQAVAVSYFPEATGADASAVMSTMSAGFASAGTVSDATESEINGKAASTVTVTSSAAGTEVTTTYIVITLEEGYALVGGTADAATMEAIAGSASFSS